MSKNRCALSKFAVSIGICLSMGACTNQGPTPTPTLVVVTAQATQTTLSIPTSTLTSTLSPHQQVTKEYPDSAIATMDAEMTIVPNCVLPLYRDHSPDGSWVALECLENGIGIYNLNDSSQSWYFSYYEIFGSKYENGNRSGRLKPEHWSVDGKYLYFAPFKGGDGGCVYYAEGQALFRLDLSSGEYSDIITPGENLPYYNFAFSNDDRYLSYFENWREPPVLNIYDIPSKAAQDIPLSGTYSEAGYLLWSPDNTKVLFSARSGEECEKMTYDLVLMDLKDQSQKIIFEGDAVKYFPVKWTDENRILIEAGFSEEYYYMDIMTGEVMPYDLPTPTSRP